MRRFTIITFFLILIAILYFFVWQKTPLPTKDTESFTPAQLHRQQIAEKRDKINRGIYKADSPDEFAKMHLQIRTKEG
ncbi:MAG: hypothetical protein ACOCXH_09585, partial [Cyclobacteriaceae bacterium]